MKYDDVSTPLAALDDLSAKAGEAARLLRVLANEHRLLILCHLISAEETRVADLVARLGIGQSALSQHLARLRHDGLVDYRRSAQSLFYRIADRRVGQVLTVLRDIYCPELAPGEEGSA
jgi:ArsR family transcriptional regulator, virulence genes transcriptional regulator